MFRINKKTREIFRPHRYKDGRFRVADPQFGKDKKLARHQIPVDSIEEVKRYVACGFHVRMSVNSRGPANLIAPGSICIA